jgi:hypothetical protein
MGSNVSRWLGKALLLTVAVAAALITIHFGEGSRGIATFAAFVGATAALWALTGSPFRLPGNEVGAAYLDMPAANAMLKEYYDDQKVENLAYQKNVALAMVPKNTDCEGKYVPVPTVYEVSQGISATFANAQGNQAPSQFVEFLVPLRPDYSITSITEQARVSSGSNVGAFMKMAKAVYDGALQGSAKSASSALYRSGTGSVSQIATGGITAGVIALQNPADIAQFSVNQTLQANSSDGGTPRAALGYVIARNVVAGTITVSATAMGGSAGSPSGWAAGDFLVRQGDNNAKITGWAAWLPLTAPTSTDNFYGVNRSPDSRLYGLAYPGQQQSIEEALIDCSMFVAREGGDPRHHFTNFGTQAALIKALGARREYVDWEKEGLIGFRGVKVQGPMGVIESYPDYACQAATGFLLQLDTWELLSVGGAVPHIKKYQDGIEMFRISNADAMELRAGYFANLAGRAPGWNAQIQFGA